MAEEHWPTLEEIEARDRGRIDEARVAAHRERMRAEQRAYRLAEIRRQHGLTQTDVAAAMRVSQRRVSAVERGDLSRTELGTVASYVEAIGGRVEVVADFGDERVVIGLRPASTRPGHVLLLVGRPAGGIARHPTVSFAVSSAPEDTSLTGRFLGGDVQRHGVLEIGVGQQPVAERHQQADGQAERDRLPDNRRDERVHVSSSPLSSA